MSVQYVFPENITADLHSRFTELAQAWQAAGLRFAAGIYTEKREILEQVVSRVEKIYTQEEQVFNNLWEALNQYTFDSASPRPIIHDVKAGTDQQTSVISTQAEEKQQQPYAPPRNQLEQQLAEIWKQARSAYMTTFSISAATPYRQ